MPKLPVVISTNLGTAAKSRSKYSAHLRLLEKGTDFCATKKKVMELVVLHVVSLLCVTSAVLCCHCM